MIKSKSSADIIYLVDKISWSALERMHFPGVIKIITPG